MDTLTINGKEYRFNISYGKFEKSCGYRAKQKNETENIKYLFKDIWLFLERRFFFKPFVFKFILKNKIGLKEVKEADKKINAIIQELMEDREGKNLDG